MANFEDYYEILQVSPSAEPEVIEAAYRKLAQKYHPDVNKSPSAADRMRKINIAHDELCDPIRRERYHSGWLRRKKEGKTAATRPDTTTRPKPMVKPSNIRKNIIWSTGIFLAVIILSYVGYQYTNKGEVLSSQSALTPTPPAPATGQINSEALQNFLNRLSQKIKEDNSMQWSNPPAMSINQNKEYLATIKTNFGDISVRLFPKEAPITVNNFVFLANQGFYDNLKFHRIVKDFVIQTGDPRGNGTGGPGYKFADEKVTRDYVKGMVAMANSGPNTNGSQFFITLADLRTVLPKNYTIFGEVSSGQNVIQKIGSVPVAASLTGEASIPTVDVSIVKVTIDEK